MENKRIIVVTGATGNQGGAVVKHLLKSDFTIRAVSRNLKSASSEKLRKEGVEVVYADLDKPETLEPILEGAYGVYSVQNNWTSDVETEIRQGKELAEAAKKAGVQHFVYSSVGGAERGTGIPHFDSKREIEKHIIQLDLPYTFVRPAYFIENLLDEGAMGFINWSLLSWALKGGKKLQVIAVNDIGAFVAHTFTSPEKYIGKGIELAGDEKNYEEIKQTFSSAMGPVPFHISLPAWFFSPVNKEVSTMLTWFKEKGYEANIDQLKTQFPTLHTYEQALNNLKSGND